MKITKLIKKGVLILIILYVSITFINQQKAINAYNNEMILNKNESPYNAQQINNKLELLQTKLDRYEGKNAITVGKQ